MALLQITEPGQAVDPHQRKRAAGIDLGTTNSLIASVRAGVAETLADEQGRHMLPSVVRYTSGGIIVGDDALTEAVNDPMNSIVSVKRLMGRGIKDLATLGDQLPYRFSATENGMPRIETVGGYVTPVEVSAEILRSLADRAGATLAGDLDGVVIAVPAGTAITTPSRSPASVAPARSARERRISAETSTGVTYPPTVSIRGIPFSVAENR